MKIVDDETKGSMNTAVQRYTVIETGLHIDAVVLDPYNLHTDKTYLVLQDDTVACCEVRAYRSNELQYVGARKLQDVQTLSKLIDKYIDVARNTQNEKAAQVPHKG